MTLTNFPNGISSFGMPIMGGPMTFGTAYFVDYRNGSDGNTGKSTTKAFKTLSKAYDTVTSNANDVIFIDGDSTVVETAMLDWSKNRVHVIGCNGVPGHYGAGAKVSLGVTTAATDIATIKVTGVRNTFSNIKFMNSNTVAEGIYCVADGEGTHGTIMIHFGGFKGSGGVHISGPTMWNHDLYLDGEQIVKDGKIVHYECM